MRTAARLYKKPDLKNAVMICGLPGIGSVAWLAANHLTKELKAQFIGEVFSPFFEPKVWLTDDGVVKLMKGDFHSVERNSGKDDLLLFTANQQPLSGEGQYDLAVKVLSVARKFGVKRLITMGGMQSDRITEPQSQPRTEDLKVYGGATDEGLVKELEQYGVVKLSGGAITGANGLLFGLAKPMKIPAVCLLAETPGFLAYDANAAKAALRVICKMLGVEVDTAVLDRQAKENLEAIQKARDMSHALTPEMRKAAEKELTYFT